MRRAGEPQAATAVLMVRPTAFASNPETLSSNAFQAEAPATEDIAARVRAEHAAVVAALGTAGVRVHVCDGRNEGDAPDEIFPNNWVSFHADGSAVLYPMLAPSRRRERRKELLDALEREHGYSIARRIDLTHHEIEERYLEGTGSLVLDRQNKVAYACRSPRTDEGALADFCEQLGYTSVVFDASDKSGKPVYHTNVVMSVGTRFAVACSEAIAEHGSRDAVLSSLEGSGRAIVDVTLDQMHAYAANLLEIQGCNGPIIALSARASAALRDAQLRRLSGYGELVTAAIPTIETYGGGSLRCMLAEIHLPRDKPMEPSA